MAEIFERFDSADGVNLSVHNSNWNLISGSETYSSIQGFRMQLTGTFNSQYWYNNQSQNGYARITVMPTEASPNGPSVGAGPSEEGYVALFNTLSSGAWTKLNITKSGVFLNTIATGLSIRADHAHEIRIRADTANYPTSIDIYASIDGVEYGPYTDSSTPLDVDSGYDGFAMRVSNTGNSEVRAWANYVPSLQISLPSHTLGSDAPYNKTATWIEDLSAADIANNVTNTITRIHWEVWENAGSGTTSGTFNYTEMEDYINQAAARGLTATFFIMYRTFTDDASYQKQGAPTDLQANYEMDNSDGAGYITAMWASDGVPRDRYVATLQGALNAFQGDPAFGGIATPETAGQDEAAGCVADGVFTWAKWKAALTAFWSVGQEYPHTGKWWGWNFFEGVTNDPVLIAAEVDDIITDSGMTNDGSNIFWTPDIVFPDGFNAVDDRVYPLFNPYYQNSAYSPSAQETCVTELQNYPRLSSMQNDSYRTTQSGYSDMSALMQRAIDELNLDGVIWLYKPQSTDQDYDPDAIAAQATNLTLINKRPLRGPVYSSEIAIGDGTASVYVPHTGPQRVLLGLFAWEGSSDITSVTYGGQSLTKELDIQHTGNTANRLEVWYLLETGIAAAANTNLIVNGTGVYRTIVSYANTAQTLQDSDATEDTATNTTTSLSMTAIANSILLALGYTNEPETMQNVADQRLLGQVDSAVISLAYGLYEKFASADTTVSSVTGTASARTLIGTVSLASYAAQAPDFVNLGQSLSRRRDARLRM